MNHLTLKALNAFFDQVIAYELGIPLADVSIEYVTSFVGNNANVTGGSFGSECAANAARIACQVGLTFANLIF